MKIDPEMILMDLVDSNYYDLLTRLVQIVGYFWNPQFRSYFVIHHSLDVNDDLSIHVVRMAINTAISGINPNPIPHSQQIGYPWL